jgi:hypothetical protein
MRRSAVCLAPQGDAITSGRMFEAIATGCLPVVLAPHAALSMDLPFPSLLSYDDFVYFSHSFDFLSTRTQGVSRLAGELHFRISGFGFRVICISGFRV